MKCGVISCIGLGDGLIALLLAQNLLLNEHEVKVFHDRHLKELSSWVPHLSIASFPPLETLPSLFLHYDKIFVFHDTTTEFICKIIQEGKRNFPEKICILNPCPSRRVGKQAYYEDSFLDPKLCMVENIALFCRRVLGFSKTTCHLEKKIPARLCFRKDSLRVVISPTSGREEKNWPKEKYERVALWLQSKGYSPVFVLPTKEAAEWKDVKEKGFSLQICASLEDFASFLYESGFWLGNDSGPGHLASFLGIPPLSIFRHHRTALLWQPGWKKGEVLFPFSKIPNLWGLRLRDRKWKCWISTRRVQKAFKRLAEKSREKLEKKENFCR